MEAPKTPDFKDLCTRVCAIAQEAGSYIARQRKTFTYDKVELKGINNLVSYVDRQAEEMIVDRLRGLVPSAGFITEEGTAAGECGEYCWIIDPLDGTTNFVHGLPPYCVSIALMQGGQTVVGVVYEITLHETFYAWKGSRAYLNGEEIKPSEVQNIGDSLIAIGFSYGLHQKPQAQFDKIAWYNKNTHGIRRIGSATADLVYVACGRFDAFSQVNLSPWDVAAGAFIAQRAGVQVSDYSGGSDFIFGREIVAANPYIYSDFLKTIQKA